MAAQGLAADSAWVTFESSPMQPRQKFQLLAVLALVAVAALTACRKEVPPPPGPDELPKPKTAERSAYALPTAYVRLGH